MSRTSTRRPSSRAFRTSARAPHKRPILRPKPESARRVSAAFNKLAKESFGDLWEVLTPTGRREFSRDLMEAASSAAAIDRVVDAWYGTWELIVAHGAESLFGALEDRFAEVSKEPAVTSPAARKELNL